MQKLISNLTRLYLPAAALSPAALAQHLQGQATVSVSLASADGLTRAMVIAFPKMDDGSEARHWSQLCVMANALQAQLGFPAPAVSISGAKAYGLWLSLAVPAPLTLVQEFMELLRKAYCPDMAPQPGSASALVELPPCLHQSTGKWAAFIHPGLGASFADEPGLEMAPPFAGQVAFLEGLQSIGAQQFLNALNQLRELHGSAQAVGAPTLVPHGLLLRDASLEDIVRFLHSKNIEPTFRHLIPKPQN
ncbi:MAG: hypothetical protein V4508_03195 [Pseudomonadota bacterium]